MEIKIIKEFVYNGFGFPVRLLHVPMVHVRGIWTPKINYNVLTETVLRILAQKASSLSGDEVRFIRLHFEMPLQDFAKRFAVSHPAVMKWENRKSRPTKMNWTTEKDIRLFILSKLNASPSALAMLYGQLQTPAKSHASPVEIDAEKLAA